MTRMMTQRLLGLGYIALSAIAILYGRVAGEGAELAVLLAPLGLWMLCTKKILI